MLKVKIHIAQGNTTMIWFVHLRSHLLEYHIIERPDINVKALGTKTYHFTGHFHTGAFAHLYELSPLYQKDSVWMSQHYVVWMSQPLCCSHKMTNII